MKNLLTVLILFFSASLSAQNITYLYDAAGNRTDRVIPFSSSLRSSGETTETTSLDDVVARQQIKIYPNPTQGLLAVEIVGFTNDLEADFLLTDLSGKVIDRRKVDSGYQTFNLSNQTNGVYLLRIHINGENTTWKIIKE
jgi:hypothetical protein